MAFDPKEAAKAFARKAVTEAPLAGMRLTVTEEEIVSHTLAEWSNLEHKSYAEFLDALADWVADHSAFVGHPQDGRP